MGHLLLGLRKRERERDKWRGRRVKRKKEGREQEGKGRIETNEMGHTHSQSHRPGNTPRLVFDSSLAVSAYSATAESSERRLLSQL